MTNAYDDNSLAAIELAIDEWLAHAKAENPAIEAIDRGEVADPQRRWFVRMRGEEKEFTTIWLVLGQRTLQYETYVMPAPEENAAELFEHLLRRNEKLVGVHFSIGAEDAVFLRGEMPLVMLTEPELDRIIGTVYATVERCFGPAIRIGFRTRFAD
jgi:hypothetical protein